MLTLGSPDGKKGGSSQNRREGRKPPVTTSANNSRLASRGQRQPRSLQGTGDGSTDGANGGRDTPWLQGFDEKWGCHYYYNTQTEESVWEPPAEGYVPWEEASRSSSAPDETHTQKQRASTGLNVAVAPQQQAPDGAKATAADAANARVDGGMPAAAGGGAADTGVLARAPPRMLTEEDVLRAMGLWQDSSGDGGGTEGVGAQRQASAAEASTPLVPFLVPSGKGAAEVRGVEVAVGPDGSGAGDGLLRNLLLRSPPRQPLTSSEPQQQRAVPPTALSEEQLLARLSLGASPMPPPPPAPAPPPPSPPPPPSEPAATTTAAAGPSSLWGAGGHLGGPKPPTLRMLTEDDILRSMGLLPAGPVSTEVDGSGSNGAKEPPPPPQAPVAAAAGPPSPSGLRPAQGPPAAQAPGEGHVGQGPRPGESSRPVLPPPSPQQPSVAHPSAPYPPHPQAPELQLPGPHHPMVSHASGAGAVGPRPAPPPGFHPPAPHPQIPANHDHQRHYHQGAPFHGGREYPPTPPLPPPGFGPPPPLFPQQPPMDVWPPPGAPPFGAPPGPPMPMLPPPPPGFGPGHSMPPYGMPPYPYHDHPYPPYGMPAPYGMPPPGFSHPGGPGLPAPPFYGPEGYLPGPPCPAGAPHPHHYPHHLHNHHHHNHGPHQPPPLPVLSPLPTPAGGDPAVASLFGLPQPASGGALVGHDACGGPEPNRRAVTWTLEELEHQLEIMAAAAGAERKEGRGGAGPASQGPPGAGSGPRQQEVRRVGNPPGFSDARRRSQGGKDAALPPPQQRREGGHQAGGGSTKPGWASAEGPSSGAAGAEEGEDDAAFYDIFAARGGVAAAQHPQRLARAVKPAVGDDDGTRRVMLDPTTAAYVRTLLPRSAAKYWMQRYSLFSRFDSLVQLDTEGWWSVTPEVLAAHQAERSRELCRRPLVAMDACCGCGGNVIQMATVFPAVIGVEISPRRVEMARHNAAVYQVGHKCHFLCADFFQVASGLKVDVLFMSPPWGGPKYQHVNTFDVFFPLVGFNKSLLALLDVTLECVRGQDGVVAAFLPRNTDLTQLAAVVPEHAVWEVERAYVNNKLKGITLYCHPGAAPSQPNVRLAAEAEFTARRPEPAAAG